jgi:Ran-binding protein 1
MNPHTYDDDEGDVDDNYDPEAEIGFEGKGPSTLQVVPVMTGEEHEETIAKFRVKTYRWNDNQWKERGVGDLKFQ